MGRGLVYTQLSIYNCYIQLQSIHLSISSSISFLFTLISPPVSLLLQVILHILQNQLCRFILFVVFVVFITVVRR